MLEKARKIHFVGIGGSGMSGLAELVMNLGHTVSGSDARQSDVTNRLADLGAYVHFGHDARFVGLADMLVVSAAIPQDNPEIMEAHRRDVQIITRAEILAELMSLRYGIAVAGSHGKTSTTAMIALILERSGFDPTVVIGGRFSVFGSGARLGSSDYMVAEADESDQTFLKLSPQIAVITNIDYEHISSFGDFEKLKRAFLEFANKVRSDGVVVMYGDDPNLCTLLPKMLRRVVTYGLEKKNSDLVAENIELAAFGSRCQVHYKLSSNTLLTETLQLQVPGRHNLTNALAAMAVGLDLGISLGQIVSALSEFRGVDRRFQLIGEACGVMIVDDYGHHPTEIDVVLDSARIVTQKRVILVFQPHRYTRTRDLLPKLVASLARADELLLTDIYAAGEDPIPGSTVEVIAEAIKTQSSTPVHLVKSLDKLASAVVEVAHPGDLVVTLGAGSIDGVAYQILNELKQRQQELGSEGC